jgi:hypothetical protein
MPQIHRSNPYNIAQGTYEQQNGFDFVVDLTCLWIATHAMPPELE